MQILPAIGETSHRGARRGLVEVGVSKDDVGRLAAQLQRDALHVAGRRLHDLPRRLDGPGKAKPVHPRMFGQRLSSLASVAGHHVDNALRRPGLHQQLRHAQRRQRGILGRLQHARATRGQRWPQDPPLADQGRIPRDDAADHADRRLQLQRQRVARHRVLHRLGPARRGLRGVEQDHLRLPGLQRSRPGDRRPHVPAFDLGQFIEVPLNQVENTQQQPLPVMRRPARPFPFERAPRRSNRKVNIGLAAARKGGNPFARGRVDHRNVLPGDRFDPAPSDQQPLGTRDEGGRQCGVAGGKGHLAVLPGSISSRTVICLLFRQPAQRDRDPLPLTPLACAYSLLDGPARESSWLFGAWRVAGSI